MQEINKTMDYVHNQWARKSTGDAQIKEKTLLDIADKVKNCIVVFNAMSRDDKKNAVEQMKTIATDFNNILDLEKGPEAEKIRSAFYKTVAFALEFDARKTKKSEQADTPLEKEAPVRKPLDYEEWGDLPWFSLWGGKK